ncbi:ATP-dependent RNA helicase DEAH12, chloroplastic-like [Asparagus officinalis]|nr:ATP-dependent RNA helicase DEAH12, chloroplastic-like [Asparagus officinalis]
MELAHVNGKLGEFTTAMQSILRYLKEGKDRVLASGEFDLFRFGRDLDLRCLVRVHSMVARECRRLTDGLPIYSSRRELLQTMFFNQVTVVIGETGSGKSTQLVQFIADAGLASMESVICTQPRKIAAISVAQRIAEESIGCYDDDNFIVSYPSYSPYQEFKSRIVFMTDHCLLQHYMGKRNFKGISYIIIDEAHERSLSTDLLLALIKKELLQSDVRVIIMSATANASKLADYFYGSPSIYVKGRNFPVSIEYVPNVSVKAAWSRVPKLMSDKYPSYVSDVIMMVTMIHRTEEGGAILAFLTSQAEVEWACESFSDPSTIVLPMHGKLSHEDQNRVMQNYPGKRKVIFATNVAETSLTIQDVKYVVDSGMVKDSRFEPSTGMNVLKVGRISQSSANQRAGRAGRTGPGKCYRLYSESDFQSMSMHQEPEIRKVHLGIAVLRILSLGIKNVQDFDFVDAPEPKAIQKALQNLIQLGAIVMKNDVFEITSTGSRLVRLDIEPRLGKIILDCFGCGLKKEGLVLAAVMANSSSIFCRVGCENDKHKADCLKLPFCHRDGDLFTLLAVYKEWEEVQESRNKWCWQNSINAKSMRRCQDTVMELEKSMRYELNTVIPSYWRWHPHRPTEFDRLLKKIILSCLVENVAMFSGSEQLGYKVAFSGQQLQLHPSCSLLVYGERPDWVVFCDVLSVDNQYLVCVNSVNYNDLLNIENPLFDVTQLEKRKMSLKVIAVAGNHLLKRFCGKYNSNLHSTISHAREECKDDNISINVDFGRREIQIFATAKDMEKVSSIVMDCVESEKRWLRDECIEKNLFYGGPGTPSTVALFGLGAGIKHLELEKRYLTVEIFHPIASDLNEKKLLRLVERYAPGIANFSKPSGSESAGSNKWGRITFLTPEFAENAVAKLNEVEFCGSLLKVLPMRVADHKTLPCSAVRAKVCWPRRRSKGVALVQCTEEDAAIIVSECFALAIGGKYVNVEISTKSRGCVFVAGIPKDVSESEIYEEFVSTSTRRILGVKLLKYEAITSVPEATCAEALRREIAPFMPNRHCINQLFQVEVFTPEPKDHVVRALLTFNGSLHLEAAKALDNLQGKVLPGCESWQKIQCQHVFYSFVSCPTRVYAVIRGELDSLLKSFKSITGVTCTVEKTLTNTYRVKISANATKTVADMRKPLEQLTRGKIVTHPGLTPTILLFLVTREGIDLLRSIERDTATYILYDRQNLSVRIFGSPSSVINAEGKLGRSLLAHHENKPLEIRLRGHNLPPDIMKNIVQMFGADLERLKEKVPGVDLSLNTRRHILYVRGTKEQKQKIEEIVSEVALSLGVSSPPDALLSSLSSECPICLCEIDEPYKLESCGHDFCHSCLVDQCESLARSHEGFPLRCTKAGCNEPFLLVDLKSLLPSDKLEDLFRASLGSFVASSNGLYRFCPSPDCPSIYKVADEDEQPDAPFVCGACSAETCTRCHLEYHPFISCERYKEFKDEPDKSLMEWRKGKKHVKDCPACGHTIEKVDGCNHIECRCGKHICWVCLEGFNTSDDCYSHLRAENHA